MTTITKTIFKGIRNDLGRKHVPEDYFYDVVNFNYDSIIGADQILYPEHVNQPNSYPVDGVFEYRFLDSNNILQKMNLCLQGGTLYKNWDTIPVVLRSGLQTGLAKFLNFNDKCFITNGKNYPIVFWGDKGVVHEMGAPAAVAATGYSANIGDYYYAISYVTAGGEEVIGTVSNTISIINKAITVYLPIGYAGTVSRKLYRTEAGGNVLKLAASIPDNSALSYTDIIEDVSLGTEIPAINNEIPKIYFIEANFQKLVGAKTDKYPTQVFVSGANIELFDSASFVDASGTISLATSSYGADNTAIMGIKADFAQILIGTEKNMCMLDVSGSTYSIIFTRSNVGVKSGYTMVTMPSNPNFDGGVMFVSSLNDVRVMNGYRNVIPNTVNDITTNNWSLPVRGTLTNDLQSATRIYAEFFDYKYILVVDDTKYVFDINTQAWSRNIIRSENYLSSPTFLSVIGDFLYNGQSNGWIEREFAVQTYLGEDVPSWIESGDIGVSQNFNFVKDFIVWLLSSNNNDITIEFVCNDDYNSKTSSSFTVDSGVFNASFYSSLYYDSSNNVEDYRMVHVSKMARWANFKITCNSGRLLFRGYTYELEKLLNKEG